MYNIRAILWTNIRNENRNKPRVSQCYKLIIEFISFFLLLHCMPVFYFIDIFHFVNQQKSTYVHGEETF